MVDDSPSQLCLVSALLDSLGYEVATASDGQTAVKQAMEFIPDLMILDMKLPPWGGIEVVYQLKADERTRATVVLAVSGYDFDDIRARASEAGVADFLQKPISGDTLRRKIAELLARRSLRRPSYEQT